VSRRVRMPASDELFRPTVVPDDASLETAEPQPQGVAVPLPREDESKAESRTASGRVRHDEKMTVYVTADELFDIEHARLQLRRTHGKAVDRGRLVRAAIAMALADLDTNGPDSELVRRLDGE
jgi:hypothetical protein